MADRMNKGTENVETCEGSIERSSANIDETCRRWRKRNRENLGAVQKGNSQRMEMSWNSGGKVDE